MWHLGHLEPAESIMSLARLADLELYGPDMEVSPEVFERYFGAWSAHAILYQDVLYPTVEHAYHCMRYQGLPWTQDIVWLIHTAPSPYRAWEISQRHKRLQRPSFPFEKVVVMDALCRTKHAQHEDVQEALKASRGFFIVKHVRTGPPADGFWDSGRDGLGRNRFGKIWERIRDRQ